MAKTAIPRAAVDGTSRPKRDPTPGDAKLLGKRCRMPMAVAVKAPKPTKGTNMVERMARTLRPVKRAAKATLIGAKTPAVMLSTEHTAVRLT